jgi:hypothetical protein
MSNTPNSNEIDEVMSSVRKLVSRGERSEDLTADDQATSAPEAASEKLLLTPALRVDDAETEDLQLRDQGNVLVLDPKKTSGFAVQDSTIAQLEAAVTQPAEDWQPEEVEAFDEADWAISAMAASEEPEFVMPKEETAADSNQPDETENALAPDHELAAFLPKEPAIDQEALREIIGQIVREELAGETGERITRNVRKLVRCEINLMLAARDLT